MKPSSKAVMIGCISFFVFLYGNLLFGGLVGSLIPGGDDFINSYFYPLYTAVTLLISLIISCTYLILKKINLLLDKMEENRCSRRSYEFYDVIASRIHSNGCGKFYRF